MCFINSNQNECFVCGKLYTSKSKAYLKHLEECKKKQIPPDLLQPAFVFVGLMDNEDQDSEDEEDLDNELEELEDSEDEDL